MATTLEALVPIFAWFILGLSLRAIGVANREHAGFVFRLIFFVTLPALVFVTVSGAELTLASAVLPLAGFLVNLACAAIAFVYARSAGLERKVTGAVVLGASITNTAFTFPFILGLLGPDAFAKAILYDVGNAVFVSAVAYAIAIRYGQPGKLRILPSVTRVLKSPLLLAVLAAIVVSLGRYEVPHLLDSTLTPLGAATMPLIMIALGLSMSASKLRDSVVYSTMLIRMVGGLAVGLAIIFAFGPATESAVVIAALASAPIGFNIVTFASIGKLDIEHATASLSMSIVIGIFTVTAIVLAGAHWLQELS